MLLDPLGADEEGVEAADRGQLAGDGRRRGAGGGEGGREAAHVAVANLGRADRGLAGPLGELAEVDRVGAAGALGDAARRPGRGRRRPALRPS